MEEEYLEIRTLECEADHRTAAAVNISIGYNGFQKSEYLDKDEIKQLIEFLQKQID